MQSLNIDNFYPDIKFRNTAIDQEFWRLPLTYRQTEHLHSTFLYSFPHLIAHIFDKLNLLRRSYWFYVKIKDETIAPIWIKFRYGLRRQGKLLHFNLWALPYYQSRVCSGFSIILFSPYKRIQWTKCIYSGFNDRNSISKIGFKPRSILGWKSLGAHLLGFKMYRTRKP